MSYQVLARKWRPKSFHEMVGQEHVLKALINALDNNRLHHAYLFTGTRGVGKTTIARIIAKCLNCETGISAKPCGVCNACVAIDEGRFVDLIEVDAASRTKVDDTRELLENVQYAPTAGRYKVYLIDEVHMLSNHSFNALLKTLEEPPPHVKFLLATTDPQKLPITVLSRCLQFSLKSMPPERVVEHLQKVLDAEQIPYESAALWELGRAADGSMRDAMTLTDQAIAYSGGSVREQDVRAMLGTIDRDFVFRLLQALVTQDAGVTLQVVAQLAEQAPDWAAVVSECVTMLQRIAIGQAVPDAVDNALGDREQVLDLAAQLTPEDVQLYYQTALMTRRDLPWVPDARGAVEMMLLRMLMFKPQLPGGSNDQQGGRQTASAQASRSVRPAPSAGPTAQVAPRIPPVQPQSSAPRATVSPIREAANAALNTAAPAQAIAQSAPMPASAPQPAMAPAQPQPALDPVRASEVAEQPSAKVINLPKREIPNTDGDPWLEWLSQLDLKGTTLNFARNCAFNSQQGDLVTLDMSPKHEFLFNAQHVERIQEALRGVLGPATRLVINLAEPSRDTPDQIAIKFRAKRQEEAEASFKADPFVQKMMEM
ncbi:MAG TPA: DNA polymerase III subunit gamma/tau, partial [Pseudomonadales bacterium]|nr:DNA polymerase III subunit gamma/tau [Pseudomonadales bacterium]